MTRHTYEFSYYRDDNALQWFGGFFYADSLTADRFKDLVALLKLELREKGVLHAFDGPVDLAIDRQVVSSWNYYLKRWEAV